MIAYARDLAKKYYCCQKFVSCNCVTVMSHRSIAVGKIWLNTQHDP